VSKLKLENCAKIEKDSNKKIPKGILSSDSSKRRNKTNQKLATCCHKLAQTQFKAQKVRLKGHVSCLTARWAIKRRTHTHTYTFIWGNGKWQQNCWLLCQCH